MDRVGGRALVGRANDALSFWNRRRVNRRMRFWGLRAPFGFVLAHLFPFFGEMLGRRIGHYRLAIDRDGRLHLPDLEPMQVAGLSFDRAHRDGATHVL